LRIKLLLLLPKRVTRDRDTMRGWAGARVYLRYLSLKQLSYINRFTRNTHFAAWKPRQAGERAVVVVH